LVVPGGRLPGLAGLSEYQRRRLELADMLRAVLPIVRGCADERREHQVRSLLTRLAAGRFQLAVAGQFSRGKTTLMNALLGGPYLPAGALPMTSVITTVRYGPRARALVRAHVAGLPLEVPVSQVARFVAESSTERVRRQVASVDVELPVELLRLGFEFVDTPGLGSAIAANTAATLRYLPRADAVVFVTGYDSALTQAESEFLVRAAGQAGQLFLVINKRDLVTEPQAADVTSYVQRWARQHLPGREPQVFGLSALEALESAVSADSERLAGGIEPFRAALIRFLTTEQGTTSLRAVAAAAALLVARQQRDLSAGTVTDPATVAAAFDARLSQLQVRLDAAADEIAGSVAAALPSLLAERRGEWKAALRDLVAAAATAPPDEDASAASALDRVHAGLTALQLAGRQAAAAWLEERAAEVRAAVIGLAASGIGSLLDLAGSARQHGAELAGLPVLASGPAGWSGEDVPDLLIPAVEWVVPDPHLKGRRGRGTPGEDVGRVLSDCRAAAVDSFVTRAGDAFRQAAMDWVERLRDQTARQAAQEAGQFRRYLTDPPRAKDVAVLADLTGRLATYSESLAGPPQAADGSPAETAAATLLPQAGHTQPCVICTALEQAKEDYLVHRQFMLATSQEDQARHAASGGFCPVHTWQYARMASPVGISAGHAAVASTIAAALDGIANSGLGSAGQLAREVAQLAADPSCAVCAVLAAAEQQAAADRAAQADQAAPPALCVRHLSLVLQAGPSEAAAQAMVRALAQALRRASADMRSYALKREALRRGLITADEDGAYRDALALLRGSPALALPAESQ
jgi:predicted GTPase